MNKTTARSGKYFLIQKLLNLSEKFKKTGCPEFPYFGARYPDATCIDGQLHDLDDCDDEGRVYQKDEYNPCPFCNTLEYMEHNEWKPIQLIKVLKPYLVKRAVRVKAGAKSLAG